MQDLTIEFTIPLEESGRARVLVVDDDPFVRDFHASVLRMKGYRVATAEDGVDALERLADEPFDLILTDQHMPMLDGASVVLALRSAGSRIPVIMVSGSLADSPLPQAVGCEIFAALSKPARIAEVLSAIARALRPEPTRENRLQSLDMHGLAA